MRTRHARRILVFLCAVALLFGMTSVAGTAFAGYDRTNIFREICEGDEIDTFRWTLSKEDSTSISQQLVGNPGLTLDRVGNMSTIAYRNPISLAEGESVELSYTIRGLMGVNLHNLFTPAEVTSEETMGDGLNLVLWPTQPQGILVSKKSAEEAPHLIRPTDNGSAVANAGLFLMYNAPAWTSNIPESGNIDALEVKVVFTQSGNAYYYLKHPSGTGYNMVAKVEAGIEIGTPEAPVTSRNFGAISQGYLTISANGGDDLITSFSDVKITKIKADESTEVIAENSLENYEFSDSSDWRLVSGNQLAGAQNAIIVDNAADDDYLIKKSVLSKHENNYGSKLFDMDFSLSVQDLTGAGEGVVYFGVTDQKDLSGAYELYSKLNAEGKQVVGMRKGSEQIIEEQEFSFDAQFKELNILCKGNLENVVTLGGTVLGTFTADLGDTYFAFGTKGVGEGSTAKLLVNQVSVNKYNYLAGTGGDFLENFDDNQYNVNNIVITVPPHLSGTNTGVIENGALTVNQGTMGWSICTAESYADFRFTFKVRSFAEYGTLGLCWGKPSPEAMYSDGSVIYIQESTFDLMDAQQQLAYQDGYSRFANLKDLGLIENLYEYDFSKGALVFVMEKIDDYVSLYIYYEDEPESELAKTPVLKLQNSYVSGSVGICGMATSFDIKAVIDDFGIENLDKHHFEDPIVSTDENDRLPYEDNIPPSLNVTAERDVIKAGEEIMVTPILYPEGIADPADITFESDNPEIASVDASGKVKALKAGTVTITAKVDELVGSVTITVEASEQQGGGDTDTCASCSSGAGMSLLLFVFAGAAAVIKKLR